jgi:hypothetical protein
MTVQPEYDLLYPLSMFRRTRGIPDLSNEVLDGSEIPQPYRDLLVRNSDMTSQLEQFHGGTIYLDGLNSSNDNRAYFSEFALRLEGDERLVEYGAIEITLTALPADIKAEVLAVRRPLGGILNRHRISYDSVPKAFLKIVPDEAICEILGSCEEPLYGRCNEITGFNGEIYARIVEILPPVPRSSD